MSVEENDPASQPASSMSSSREEAASALFRKFFSISPDGIVLLDNDDRILKANPAFLELFGYELDEVLGHEINDLIVDPAFHEEARSLSHQALDSRPVHQESLRCRKNGDLINVEIFGTPLMLEDRQVGIYGIYRDITARRQAEDLLEQSEAKHRTIVECMNDGYFEIDLAGNLLFFNQSLARIFDTDVDELGTLNLRQFFQEETNARLYEDFNRIYRSGEIDSRVSWQFTASENRLRHLEASVSLILSDQSEPVGFRGVVRDVTDRVEAIEALRHSEELFRLVTENTGQLVYDFDLESGRIQWSGAVKSVLGLCRASAEQFDIENWTESLHPDDRARCLRLLSDTARSGEPYRVEYRLHRLGDDYIHVEDRGAYLRDAQGLPTRLIGTLTDITQRKRQEEALAYQASHDALTGLGNRFKFEQAVDHLSRDAAEHGRTHVFLYMDLDQFKVVNDTCGHDAGDELLQEIAQCINELVRRDDLLARLGGDEFGLLLSDCTIESGVKIAEKVISRINDYQFTWQNHRFSVGISIGLVALDGTRGFVDLLKAADQACYVAKDQGRNRYRVYHEEDSILRQRSAELQAVADVNSAIIENRFELYLQKIFALDENTTPKGGEILLRMRDRDGRLIPPGEFILGAERYNRMAALDRWVVENAFRQIGRLCQDRRIEPEQWFSINLSGATIDDAEFGAFVCETLRQHQVRPELVCFEITESAAITHHRNAVRFLDSVRTMGCRVMLDDFGSGLSSFAYLKTLPIDFIKIDGTLIQDIARSDFNLAIVRAVHEFARVLGIPLIAEHVEQPAELERLRDIGVEYVQGFLLHEPERWSTLAAQESGRERHTGS
jgi:diguanylate cyclase (GGDEF)-like protein/PAS domain S-box-containing protein